jgi:hypothetical protein
MSDRILGIASVGFHIGKKRKKVSQTVRTLGLRRTQVAKTERKVDDAIDELRRAVAGFRPGRERLAATSRGMVTEVKRTTEARRRPFAEADLDDIDATAPADAAVLALQRASASVDDALAELEWQLADTQLRLDPERDQAARAAEAVKREKEAEELKQTTQEFVEAGARLAEALRQVTQVSAVASDAATIVVKAVSEIMEATKTINGELESYVHLVVSTSAPIHRQLMPLTLMEMTAPSSPTSIPPPLLEAPSDPLFQGAAA